LARQSYSNVINSASRAQPSLFAGEDDMSQEWFYTKDGRNKIGPISPAELHARAKSGELMLTHMVWKEGMAKWTAASAIKGLFTGVDFAQKPPSYGGEAEAAERVQIKTRPVPPPAGEQGLAIVTVLSRVALGLAVVFSLLAALLALLRIGGGAIAGVLAILLGSVGVLLALVADGIGLRARKGRPFMETAAIAVFLGIAALLFSIGSTLAARTIREYRDIAAKADEVEQERNRAETARREAKLFKADAEKARDDALDQPNEILKRAKDISKQNEENLEQIKTEKTALNKNRGEVDAEIRMKRDEVDTEVKIKRDDLAKIKAGLAREKDDLAANRESIAKQELALEKQKQVLAEKNQQLALDLKKPQALKDKAEESHAQAKAEREKAEKKEQEAKAALEQSDQKEKEAKAHYKKVIDELKNALKPKTKAAINAIERIGPLPRSASLDLCEINYDLCDIAVNDAKLRQDAVNAIFKIDRGLGDVATTIMKPPDGTSFDKFVETINEVPKYGPGGLPLIQGILTQRNFKVQGRYGYWRIFEASVEVLAKVANDDERALTMLTNAPKSSYAMKYEEYAVQHNRLFAMDIPNQNPDAPAQWLHPRYTVGEHLFEVCMANPATRKKTEVTDYFIELLKETKSNTVPAKLTDENQVLAATALASFGVDAKRALPQLRAMRSDNSAEVRKAVGDAVEKIEESK
jgi:hypothetical protein